MKQMPNSNNKPSQLKHPVTLNCINSGVQFVRTTKKFEDLICDRLSGKWRRAVQFTVKPNMINEKFTWSVIYEIIDLIHEKAHLTLAI